MGVFYDVAGGEILLEGQMGKRTIVRCLLNHQPIGHLNILNDLKADANLQVIDGSGKILFNFLIGKEFKIGKKKGLNKLLGLNGTLTAIGGERYTPIDLIASRAARETIRDESQPYTGQEKPLFIFDFTLTIQNNKERYTGIWAIQLKNMFSNRVPEYREYDALLDQEIFQAGASILPVLSYKVEF